MALVPKFVFQNVPMDSTLRMHNVWLAKLHASFVVMQPIAYHASQETS
jgi:hypothetical protein